jgi:hypothetical protein
MNEPPLSALLAQASPIVVRLASPKLAEMVPSWSPRTGRLCKHIFSEFYCAIRMDATMLALPQLPLERLMSFSAGEFLSFLLFSCWKSVTRKTNNLAL